MSVSRGQAIHARSKSGASQSSPLVHVGRVQAVDAIRGVAIIAMIAYHFCFDLRHFGLTAWDFYRDPFWLHARTLILSSFLMLAGVSLVLADANGLGRARFWRHIVRIGACAIGVSIASYLIFPRSYIWFGVLHAIALSLILIRPVVAHPRVALALGLVVVAAAVVLSSPWFDNRIWGWIGFMTTKPETEDYVPLFPWMGVMLVGIAIGHALMTNEFRAVSAFARLPRFVKWLGRHSLAVYMIHQPLLLGALYAITHR